MSHSYQTIELEAGTRHERQPLTDETTSSKWRASYLIPIGLGVIVLIAMMLFAAGGRATTTQSATTQVQAELQPSTSAVITPIASLQTTVLNEKNEKDSKHDKKDVKEEKKELKEEAKKEEEKVEEEKEAEENAQPHTEALCLDPNYTKLTLKTANEMTMVALFNDLHGQKKFEASDVIHVKNHYLVVYDNLYEIGRIEQGLDFYSAQHQLIRSNPRREGDSGFEALLYNEPTNTYFVVIEAELEAADEFHRASLEVSSADRDRAVGEVIVEPPHPPSEFHAYIEEIAVPEDSSQGYSLVERCRSQFKFISGNKGFEGAVHVTDSTGSVIILGLCEGNFCEGGKRGREKGNGRIVLMKKRPGTDDLPCEWETINLLALPVFAAFADYSAIAILPVSGPTNKKGNLYHLAVTSQESSQVWIGELRVGDSVDARDWSLTDGQVYNFPRSNSCEIEYCNIEGISFVDDNLLVAVSDKMKGAGRQHYRCLRKDQSIHAFVLP